MSQASAGFFIVEKKGGGQRPCIDFRGLNQVTIKYRHPLPLVPANLEQLHEAWIFTKLDLWSAYILVHIREVSGRQHLASHLVTLSISCCNKCCGSFISYIDDILIYSLTKPPTSSMLRVLAQLLKHQFYVKDMMWVPCTQGAYGPGQSVSYN